MGLAYQVVKVWFSILSSATHVLETDAGSRPKSYPDFGASILFNLYATGFRMPSPPVTGFWREVARYSCADLLALFFSRTW